MSIVYSSKERADLKELGDFFSASEIESLNLTKKTPKKNIRNLNKEFYEDEAARLKNQREKNDQDLKGDVRLG